MEEVDKGCPMIRMGVSRWMLLLVPAYPGSPGQRPLNVCVCFIIPAKARDYVFTGVGLSVCLFVCLLPR